jgi:hypothetical protein
MTHTYKNKTLLKMLFTRIQFSKIIQGFRPFELTAQSSNQKFNHPYLALTFQR